LDEVEKALKGVLIPKTVEVIEGRGEVIATFPIRKGGRVAGVRVTEGKVRQDASVRIMRRGKVISESVVTSLKRYQDTVKEVLAGLEAGVGVKGFKDFEIGDIVEFYRIEKTYGVSRK
jgi:translation initiation factor IF-2